MKTRFGIMNLITSGLRYFSAGAHPLPEEPTALSEEPNVGDENSRAVPWSSLSMGSGDKIRAFSWTDRVREETSPHPWLRHMFCSGNKSLVRRLAPFGFHFILLLKTKHVEHR